MGTRGKHIGNEAAAGEKLVEALLPPPLGLLTLCSEKSIYRDLSRLVNLIPILNFT